MLPYQDTFVFQVYRGGLCTENMEKKRLSVLTAVQICGKHVAGELSSDKNQTVCDCRSKSISPGKPSREKKWATKFWSTTVFTALSLLLTVSRRLSHTWLLGTALNRARSVLPLEKNLPSHTENKSAPRSLNKKAVGRFISLLRHSQFSPPSPCTAI